MDDDIFFFFERERPPERSSGSKAALGTAAGQNWSHLPPGRAPVKQAPRCARRLGSSSTRAARIRRTTSTSSTARQNAGLINRYGRGQPHAVPRQHHTGICAPAGTPLHLPARQAAGRQQQRGNELASSSPDARHIWAINPLKTAAEYHVPAGTALSPCAGGMTCCTPRHAPGSDRYLMLGSRTIEKLSLVYLLLPRSSPSRYDQVLPLCLRELGTRCAACWRAIYVDGVAEGRRVSAASAPGGAAISWTGTGRVRHRISGRAVSRCRSKDGAALWRAARSKTGARAHRRLGSIQLIEPSPSRLQPPFTTYYNRTLYR